MASLFTVRRATDADSGAVRDLVQSVCSEFGISQGSEDLEAVASYYEANGGWFEVLEQDNQLVGTIGMLPLSDGTIELRKMYFRPAVRGHGMGKALLARNIGQAQRAGFDFVDLETATVLETAISLYRRFGFNRVERSVGCSSGCDQAWQLSLQDYEVPPIATEMLDEK